MSNILSGHENLPQGIATNKTQPMPPTETTIKEWLQKEGYPSVMTMTLSNLEKILFSWEQLTSAPLLAEIKNLKDCIKIMTDEMAIKFQEKENERLKAK